MSVKSYKVYNLTIDKFYVEYDGYEFKILKDRRTGFSLLSRPEMEKLKQAISQILEAIDSDEKSKA